MKRSLLSLIALAAGSMSLLAQPTITQQPTNQVVTSGGTVLFSVAVSGDGPFTYQWQFNGTNLPNDIITTVAGSGSGNYAGDGGAATNTSLCDPAGVTSDKAGNLYIADKDNDRIRKIDANGVITTVAGGGSSGDGSVATNASLNGPVRVTLDAFASLYIVDSYNHRIRRVDTNGIITTVAGKGTPGYSGDGGAATNAALNSPRDAVLDASGNLYIADTLNERIRKVDTNGIITTVAGNGTSGYSGDNSAATNASLYYPSGITLDAYGNLFIADTSNYRVRKVDINSIITTVAGNGNFGYSGDNGAATNASLNQPQGMNLDAFGNLYIADTSNQRIRRVGTNGIITTAAGGGSGSDGNAATNAYLSSPQDVTIDAVGNLYIADAGKNLIRQVNTNGIITTVAGSGGVTYVGDNGAATNANLHYPQGVGFDAAGNLYIADNNNDRVRQVDTNSIITTVAGNGIGSGTNGGSFSGDGGAATNAGLYRPNNLAFDAVGDMYIADIFNNRVRMVNANDVITTVAGNGTNGDYGDGGPAINAGLALPACVALDASGNLFIADLAFGRIRKVDTNGIITTVAGGGSQYPGDGGAATNASLRGPQGVAVDVAGNFYIADSLGPSLLPLNGRVRRVDTNGIITTVAGGGGLLRSDGYAATNALLGQPWGVVLDAIGNMYIADKGFNLVRKVDTNGIITTVAGKFSTGFSGDGGAATNATLNGPACVALDAAGNLYIADWYNNRIREVHFAGFPTLTLNNVSVSNAGTYTVVVTSPGGSVTSSNVTLTVVVPPDILAFATTNGVLNFTWNTQSNLTYQLQYTTNLATPVWQNIGSSITATNGTAAASDISDVDAQRFYRVQWVP